LLLARCSAYLYEKEHAIYTAEPQPTVGGREGGIKTKHQKPLNLTFPFTFYVLEDLVIFIHSLERCNPATAEKGARGDKHGNSSGAYVVPKQTLT